MENVNVQNASQNSNQQQRICKLANISDIDESLSEQSKHQNLSVTYERNFENDSRKGLNYEEVVTMFELLNLKKEQSLAREMKPAGKFDDLVMRVSSSTSSEPYYHLRQLKHSAKRNFQIKETDLIGTKGKKNGPFSLPDYCLSFIEIVKKDVFKSKINNAEILIKEISIMTNVKFEKMFLKNFLDPHTERSVWGNSATGERYKFKNEKHQKLGNMISVYFNNQKKKSGSTVQNTIPTSDDIAVFLSLLVFEVGQPNVKEMEEIVKNMLKTLLPIKCVNSEQVNDAYEILEQSQTQCFRDLNIAQKANSSAVKPQANWATHQLVNVHLTDITKKMINSRFKFGSSIAYHNNELVPLNKNFRVPDGYCILKKVDSGYHKNLKIVIENLSLSEVFKILNIVVDPSQSVPKLTSSKIHSLFPESNQFSFVRLETESDTEAIAYFGNELKFQFTENHIMVLEFTPEFPPEKYTSWITTKVKDKLTSQTAIKMILISSKKIDNQELNGIQTESYEDSSLAWEELTEGTRKYLYEKTWTVKCNGNHFRTNLKQLKFDLLKVNDWIDSKSIAELTLYDEGELIDFLMPDYNSEIEETYVRRKLKVPRLVSIKNMGTELKNRLRYDKTKFEEEKEQGRDKYRAHLLSTNSLNNYEEITHVWLESFGCDFSELTTFSVYPKDLLNEHEILDENFYLASVPSGKPEESKCAIIVDRPGMGKSTYFSFLCNYLLKKMSQEKKKTRKFVLRIDLGRCGSKTWDAKLNDSNDAIHFLINQAEFKRNKIRKGSSVTSLNKTIISEIMKGNSTDTNSTKVIVLLDGLDEISERGRNCVFQLVSHLMYDDMKGIERILVASRPDGKIYEKFELKFGRLALHLQELDENDKNDLLTSLWMKKLRKDSVHFDLEKCKMFAQELFNRAKNELIDQHFLDIPLQCLIFSECFYKNLKDWLKTGHYNSFFSEKNNLSSLFKNFVEIKFEIFYHEKSSHPLHNDTDEEEKLESKKQFDEMIVRFALVYMLRNEFEATDLFLEKHYLKNENVIKDLKHAKKLGLLAYYVEPDLEKMTDISSFDFQFVHRTIPEYFFALFLYNSFQDPTTAFLKQEKAIDLILEKIFVDDEYAGVRRFFGKLIESKMELLINQGCPFSMRLKDEVLSFWPIFGHVEFNDQLAEKLLSHKSSFFKTIPAQENYLTEMLVGCLKEHITRKLLNDPKTDFHSLISTLRHYLHLEDVSWSLYSLEIKGSPNEKRLTLFFTLLAHPKGVESETSLSRFYFQFDVMNETRNFTTDKFVDTILRESKVMDACLAVLHSMPKTCWKIYDIRQLASKLIFVTVNDLPALTNFFLHFEKTYCEIGAERFSHQNSELNLLKNHQDLLTVGNTWSIINESHSDFDYIKRVLNRFKIILELSTWTLENLIRWFLSIRKHAKDIPGYYFEGSSREIYSNIQSDLSNNETQSDSKNDDKGESECDTTDKSVNKSVEESDLNHSLVTLAINVFPVQFVNFIILQIHLQWKPPNKIAEEYMGKVIRHALRFDVTILKWLDLLRFYDKEDGIDHEKEAIERAMKCLPELHQAAHKGDFSLVQNCASKSFVLLRTQFFQWTPYTQENDDGLGESNDVNNQRNEDFIPPAFYIAVANNCQDFCVKALTFLKINIQELKHHAAKLMQYAIYGINREELALTFFDITDTLSGEDYLSSIVREHNETALESGAKLFADFLWVKFTIKLIERMDTLGKREFVAQIVKYFSLTYFKPLNEESIDFDFNLLEMIPNRYTNITSISSIDRKKIEGNIHLSSFLLNCVLRKENWTSELELEPLHYLAKIAFGIVKDPVLKIADRIEELLPKFIDLVWAQTGDEDFVRFVLRDEVEGVYIEFLYNTTVRKYIPEKLSTAGLKLLVEAITQWRHIRSKLCCQCFLLFKEFFRTSKDAKEFFRVLVRRLLDDSELGAPMVEQLLFSADEEGPWISTLLRKHRKFAESIFDILGNKSDRVNRVKPVSYLINFIFNEYGLEKLKVNDDQQLLNKLIDHNFNWTSGTDENTNETVDSSTEIHTIPQELIHVTKKNSITKEEFIENYLVKTMHQIFDVCRVVLEAKEPDTSWNFVNYIQRLLKTENHLDEMFVHNMLITLTFLRVYVFSGTFQKLPDITFDLNEIREIISFDLVNDVLDFCMPRILINLSQNEDFWKKKFKLNVIDLLGLREVFFTLKSPSDFLTCDFSEIFVIILENIKKFCFNNIVKHIHAPHWLECNIYGWKSDELDIEKLHTLVEKCREVDSIKFVRNVLAMAVANDWIQQEWSWLEDLKNFSGLQTANN